MALLNFYVPIAKNHSEINPFLSLTFLVAIEPNDRAMKIPVPNFLSHVNFCGRVEKKVEKYICIMSKITLGILYVGVNSKLLNFQIFVIRFNSGNCILFSSYPT